MTHLHPIQPPPSIQTITNSLVHSSTNVLQDLAKHFGPRHINPYFFALTGEYRVPGVTDVAFWASYEAVLPTACFPNLMGAYAVDNPSDRRWILKLVHVAPPTQEELNREIMPRYRGMILTGEFRCPLHADDAFWCPRYGVLLADRAAGDELTTEAWILKRA